MGNRNLGLFALTLCLFSVLMLSSAAQERKPWQFPSELRSDLNDRLERFLNAQVEGRWEYVSDLLGEYRRGSVGYVRYTPAHKTCLVSQMKDLPMTTFDYTVQESPFSSEILSTPPGRRWWTLVGEGSFRVGSTTVKRKAWLIAYRDQDRWYFSPSNFDDEASARSQLTDEEVSRDRKDQVELLVPPDSPLEVVDLHVFINPKNLKSRRVHFRLHNRTPERITRYGFKISDERQDGSIEFGTGAAKDAIDGGDTSRAFDEDHAAYLYWCEGESKLHIKINDVYFENGREWNSSKSDK